MAPVVRDHWEPLSNQCLWKPGRAGRGADPNICGSGLERKDEGKLSSPQCPSWSTSARDPGFRLLSLLLSLTYGDQRQFREWDYDYDRGETIHPLPKP